MVRGDLRSGSVARSGDRATTEWGGSGWRLQIRVLAAPPPAYNTSEAHVLLAPWYRRFVDVPSGNDSPIASRRSLDRAVGPGPRLRRRGRLHLVQLAEQVARPG